MSAVALGAIIGASWGGIVASRIATQVLPQQSKPRMVEKFRARLNLSPEQTQRVDSVLDETQREFSQLHQAVKPQFDELKAKREKNGTR